MVKSGTNHFFYREDAKSAKGPENPGKRRTWVFNSSLTSRFPQEAGPKVSLRGTALRQ